MQESLAVWKKDSHIVLGIDVGATRSAVAYSHLYKGGTTIVNHVGGWPGQKSQKSDGKIPTQIYYNKLGEAVKIGAETLTDEALIEADEQGWHLVKHFKLNLHPDTMRRQHNLTVEDLPSDLTLTKIYVDFMRYLLKHTKHYFETHVLQGKEEWSRHSPSMEVVIAHPNGWGLNEQDFLRKAAVAAGYATSQNAQSQIKFVSEAEASVHFCILQLDLNSTMNSGIDFIVCDAGGSTVDTTAYGVKTKIPVLQLEEKKASDCIQAGGVFVDRAAESYLRRLLTEARVREDDLTSYVARGVEEFEIGLKRNFDGGESTGHYLMVADRRQNNKLLRRGTLTLENNVVESFFKARVDEIIRSVELQMSDLNIKHILIAGGFGGSPYLRAAIEQRFRSCQITTVDDGPSKAVADGAVIWRINSNVKSRAPRFSFGVNKFQLYDPHNRAHAGRHSIYWPDGRRYVSGYWSVIARRGVVVHADTAVLQSYERKYDTPKPNLSQYSIIIYAFTTPGMAPEWVTDTKGNLNTGFKQMCTVRADLSGMRGLLIKEMGSKGYYWILKYRIGIRFGGTELEAFIEWTEGNKTCTSKAAVIPMGLE